MVAGSARAAKAASLTDAVVASSSRMVPVPWPTAMPAPDAAERLTKKVSSASTVESLRIATAIVFVVSPGLNVSVPLVAV